MRAHRARRSGWHAQSDDVRAQGAAVVDGLDAHLGPLRARVDEAQAAHLVDVAPGVEGGDAVHTPARRDPVVHGGEEAVGGADVGEHLELELGAELEPPVALAGARCT